jgi:radical SAM-linked protein
MQGKPRYRYRLRFAKTEAMRWTGHLDLQRTWERAFRRARLPLLYSMGFNPRPRTQLAAALPLGVTGEEEILDLWLTEPLETDEIARRLARALPPGLALKGVTTVPLEEAPLQRQVVSAEYRVAWPENPPPPSELQAAVERVLAARELPRERRGKRYDLRPLIQELRLEKGDGLALVMRLAAREGATGRPDEVLAALGLDPAEARVVRTKLFFR